MESRVDVIFAFGDEAIVAAQVATKTIPIVMLACDAVTTGFVASLARPGGNTTGVTCITTELSGKRVAVFREMLPGLKHLAVLYNPENKSKRGDFQKTREVANSLGVRVAGFEVRELEDIERVFAGWKTATSRVRTWRLNTGGLGQVDRLPALAAELAGHSVAIFVTTGGGSAALAAKAATSTIPIVFSMGDP